VTPSTRLELNRHLLAGRFAIESASEANDAVTCANLKDHLERLESFKSQFPTKDEISLELQAAKVELEVAMSKKEFRKCSELNTRIAGFEQALCEATKFGGSLGGRMSVADLKERKAVLEAEVAESLAKKLFDRCGDLQPELDSLAAELARRDLTGDEAVVRLHELHEAMRDAKTSKDFFKMAMLHEDIEELNNLTTVAPSAAETPESGAAEIRDELENKTYEELTAMILGVEASVQQAIAAKNFKLCDELERELTRIGDARAKLPVPEPKLTRTELEQCIKKSQKDLDDALASKNYKLCDELNAQLEMFRVKLEAIPTASGIASQIAKLEAELKSLLSAKAYAKCEEVETKLAELRPQYDALRAEELAAMPAAPVVAVKAKKTTTSAKGSVAGTAPAAKAKPIPAAAPVQTAAVDESKEHERPVSKLRPKAPLTVEDSQSILDVAKVMALNRSDAVLLIGAAGGLSGILTDNDMTRRVVSQYLDPTSTSVHDVMTKNPKCVHMEDSALDALEMMVDNRFRHLPVLDKDGVVVGLLDIAKCLYDAISVLEKVQQSDESGGGGASDGAALAGVMASAMQKMAGGRGTNKAQVAAMQLMMEQMFGGSMPTLRSIIGHENFVSVRPSANVREAATLMAQARKGVLVMDEDELVGIFTPKDLLSRVVAKGKSPDLTAVSSVMTPNPDCVQPDLTLLDALREMHDHKFLHLPVREEDGTVLGLVDVMELVCNTAGGNGKGWRDFFSGAMSAKNDRDVSDTSSQRSNGSSVKRSVAGTKSRAPIRAAYYDDDKSDVFSVGISRPLGGSPSRFGGYDAEPKYHDEFIYKVTDAAGNTHRIKASAESVESLKAAVADKLGVSTDGLTIKYVDDDKDEVVISTDASVKEAVEFARSSALTALKLTATVPSALALGASSLLKGFTAMQTPAPKAGEAKAAAGQDDNAEDASSAKTKTAATGAGSSKGQAFAVGVAGVAVAAVAVIAAFVVMRKK